MNELKLKPRKNFRALYAIAAAAAIAFVTWFAAASHYSKQEQQTYTLIPLLGVYPVEASIYHAKSGVMVERFKFDRDGMPPRDITVEPGDRLVFRVYSDDPDIPVIRPDDWPGCGSGVWIGKPGEKPDPNKLAGRCGLSGRRQEATYIVGSREFRDLLNKGDIPDDLIKGGR